MLWLIIAVTESTALDPEIAFIARDRDKRETGTGKSPTLNKTTKELMDFLIRGP